MAACCVWQRRWAEWRTCRSLIPPPAPSRCAGSQRRATSASTASSTSLRPAAPRTWWDIRPTSCASSQACYYFLNSSKSLYKEERLQVSCWSICNSFCGLQVHKFRPRIFLIFPSVQLSLNDFHVFPVTDMQKNHLDCMLNHNPSLLFNTCQNIQYSMCWKMKELFFITS